MRSINFPHNMRRIFSKRAALHVEKPLTIQRLLGVCSTLKYLNNRCGTSMTCYQSAYNLQICHSFGTSTFTQTSRRSEISENVREESRHALTQSTTGVNFKTARYCSTTKNEQLQPISYDSPSKNFSHAHKQMDSKTKELNLQQSLQENQHSELNNIQRLCAPQELPRVFDNSRTCHYEKPGLSLLSPSRDFYHQHKQRGDSHISSKVLFLQQSSQYRLCAPLELPRVFVSRTFHHGKPGLSLLSQAAHRSQSLLFRKPNSGRSSGSCVGQQQLRFYRGGGSRKESRTDQFSVEGAVEVELYNSFEKDVSQFDVELQESERDLGLKLSPTSADEMTLTELSRHACNLVPYVRRSETLQNLVRLGVNLDLVQRVEGVAELLLQSKFDRDVAPLLHLLHMMGVPGEEMGSVLTRNPLLFTQSIEDLSARFGYLLHQGFRQKEAASIVIRAPVTLMMDPTKLHSKLTFMQTTFGLTGQELRQVILKYPKLLPWRRDMIATVRFHLKDFLTFSDADMKAMLIKEPKIYMSSTRRLTEAFDYLYNDMGISRRQVLLWPGILRTRPHIVKGRHLFLVSRGQAQYDPCLENYVSLKVLGSGPDSEFCHKVAKCDEKDFYDFLKTL